MSITKTSANNLNLLNSVVVFRKDVFVPIGHVMIAQHMLLSEIEPQIGDLQMLGEQIGIEISISIERPIDELTVGSAVPLRVATHADRRAQVLASLGDVRKRLVAVRGEEGDRLPAHAVVA